MLAASYMDLQSPADRVSTCVTCGAVFSGFRIGLKYCRKPCTSEMAHAARKKVVDGPGKHWSRGKEYVARRPCVMCGALFYAPPAQRRRGGGKCCSRACRDKMQATSPETFPQTQTRRGKGGKREDLENRYFRSSWEANWARYLNWLAKIQEIQGWRYEPETFEFVGIKRGSRFYTPDFRVVNKDGSVEYHEIKGYMDERSATKLKRMAKYYPAIKLILVDQAAYRAVARKVAGMVQGWEQWRSGS